ncbi:MAG: signal recognition particle protein [Syntrophothermus sp.]|uniref:signal recognition particle protein n=1 Tax=Syntrophothermus sp. TaxID=2736299 RepID=UPI0025800CC1|nr:signal recognition particle protein [Syntrophothermus sp.]NSW82359.1 signal recognition particle protein [Syntrophothermus sp.]
MIFEGLSTRLQETFRKLRGKGKLTEEDVNLAMREVRLALLEADVNYKVVKDFVARVKERAVGQEVLKSLTPGQQVVKIVYEELTQLMGGDQTKLNLAAKPPTVVMMVGLQGTGKTTTCAKLARSLLAQGRRPLLVAADIYRPAAIKQLQVLGEKCNCPVFSMGQENPVNIARAALEYARSNGRDVVILDTAGRLHINEELMNELKDLKSSLNPHEILLVVDAMTGQDAVNVASSFNEQLGLTGVVLTKLDGDTRGGAALSVKAVAGCPIKFAGVGEKLEDLEPFYPNRMASRILGMGDVQSLVEKAQASIDEKKARELGKKIRQQEFTLEDFLDQIQQVRSMGPLEDLLAMIPGFGNLKQLKGFKTADIDDKEISRIEAIIKSMTPEERLNPTMLNSSRKKRIAKGSGTRVQDVNRLLKHFEESQKLMRQFSDKGGKKKGKGLRLPF